MLVASFSPGEWIALAGLILTVLGAAAYWAVRVLFFLGRIYTVGRIVVRELLGLKQAQELLRSGHAEVSGRVDVHDGRLSQHAQRISQLERGKDAA